MKPSARRKVERRIQSIMKDDGDRCSVCKADFPNNCKTFGGVTVGGVAALVGECCKAKLRDIILAGVYVDHRYNDVVLPIDSSGCPPANLPSNQIAHAVEGLQDRFRGIDNFARQTAKRGGVAQTPIPLRLNTRDSSWKTDDANWFSANPLRSHRLRPLLPGEAANLFGSVTMPTPPTGHSYQVLVRQIEPGKRIRMPFAQRSDAALPDIESLLHALFDLAGRARGGVVNSREIAVLAKRYANSGADPL